MSEAVHFSIVPGTTVWTPQQDVVLEMIYAAGGDVLISTDPAADIAAFQANPAVDSLAIAQIAGSSSILIPVSVPVTGGAIRIYFS